MCDIGSFSPSTATPRALRPSIVVIYVNVSTRTPRQWMPTLNGLFAQLLGCMEFDVVGEG